MNNITEQLLRLVADFKGSFQGAFNIREDGQCAGRQSSEHIKITSKADGKPGLDIHIDAGTQGETVYIPACVTHSDVDDLVYNVGAGAAVLTDGNEWAKTTFDVALDGEDCSADVVSRSVAKGESYQEFISSIHGNNRCYGHSSCDAILAEHGRVNAQPALEAAHLDAQLIHEAAIGKIAGEQLLKLQTLGLTAEQAEERIIEGFLK